ncbi:hypothetical protein M422DRAFT_49629 [Sphaerobolus stellatus SS14]|uniref:Uncharacterized protein n=1 Tax=Sphaerobolus stellatus (strain SS14) TaxID=990650 RepID=A0A0C9UX94_SPHS4|nr:hypothetical protein M422DRAFT_49629 [Sphaerobolus stellatus SS14]
MPNYLIEFPIQSARKHGCVLAKSQRLLAIPAKTQFCTEVDSSGYHWHIVTLESPVLRDASQVELRSFENGGTIIFWIFLRPKQLTEAPRFFLLLHLDQIGMALYKLSEGEWGNLIRLARLKSSSGIDGYYARYPGAHDHSWLVATSESGRIRDTIDVTLSGGHPRKLEVVSGIYEEWLKFNVCYIGNETTNLGSTRQWVSHSTRSLASSFWE